MSRNGYKRLGQSPGQDSDDPLLDDNTDLIPEDQATFQLQFHEDNETNNIIPVGEPSTSGPSTSSNQPLSIQAEAYSDDNLEECENGVLLSFDRHEFGRGISLIDVNAQSETEENLKCIVTTLLFFAIIVTLVIVAFLINPAI